MNNPVHNPKYLRIGDLVQDHQTGTTETIVQIYRYPHPYSDDVAELSNGSRFFCGDLSRA